MGAQSTKPTPAPGGGGGGQRVGKKQFTAAEFIARAENVHGVGAYNYSQVVYTNAKTKVIIICPQHGAFEQAPDTHTSGSGCPTCGNLKISSTQKQTLADFIAKAQAVHGMSTYDYSLAVYTGSANKVTIICPKHGIFRQTPTCHLRGSGCNRCGRARIADAGRFTTAQFIEKAQSKHGTGTYDYSQVVYIKNRVNVIIICPVHGSFEQTPNSHLSGKGCTKCAGNTINTTAYFVLKARKRHGNKYDYSRSEYTGAHNKIRIVCPVHGEFEQRPNAHYGGQGCPACGRESKALNWILRAGERPATLYLIRIYGGGENFYKVGVTVDAIRQRYAGFRDMPKPYRYEVLAQHVSNAARVYEWEQSILETFTHLRYKPVRQFGGATECFSSADEILAIFPL